MGYTIKDIAKDAGVSITTISKIINGNDADISQKTKERVMQVIADRNYIPSSFARSLVTKRTNIIGLVIPDITNSYFAELARGIEEGLKQNSYFVIFCNTADNPDNENHYLKLLLKQSVDGIIMIPTTDSKYQDIDNIIREKKPTVFLDRVFDEVIENLREGKASKQGIVLLDNVKGGYIATRHLIEHGHQRIGCITGPLKNKSACDRLQGYRQALDEAGIAYQPELVVEGNYRHNSGEQAAAKLLDQGITAMFIHNDLMAVSAYNAIEQRGLKVGTDISIVGYDDTEYCSWVTPKLSSVAQSTVEMGRYAAQMMCNLLCGEAQETHHEFLPQLRERKSVGQL